MSKILQAKAVSFSRHGIQYGRKNTISGVHVHVSPGSAETLVRRGGITNYHLIAYLLNNITAINYQNPLMCVEVIVCNISVVFLRHSVHVVTFCCCDLHVLSVRAVAM